MARTYDTILDFLGPGDTDGATVDSISVSPFVVVAAWRYKYPITYSRERQKSFVVSPTEAIALRDTMLLIVDDVKSMSVNTTKTQHINSMRLELHPGMNYLSELLPGDIVAGWMVNDQDSFNQIISNLSEGKAANQFMSGLKFLGKVNTVQKKLVQTPNGIKSTSYSVTAHGFTELDASIYYEPYLETASAGIATQYLKQTGVKLNDLIRENKLGLDINKVIPIYLAAFYGPGVPKNQLNDNNGLNTTQGLDNPNAFVVPAPIANMLNITQPTKPNGLFSFVDTLDVLYGVQKYDNVKSEFIGTEQIRGDDNANGYMFSPKGVSLSHYVRMRYTNIPMIGTYLPSPPQFNGQRSVWQILSQFLNPAVNEMYTCMRANSSGFIMPTLVVRQLPFSSGGLSETFLPRPVQLPVKKAPESTSKRSKKKQEPPTQPLVAKPRVRNVTLTRMLELPRWKIHPVLVRAYNVGRSDTMRLNFLYTDADSGVANPNRTGTFVRNQPFSDELDIARNGFRPYFASVNCSPKDVANHDPTTWMYILSDILFGQHLTLTGSIELYGIQAPIVPGDNIEFDDAIFHIESVGHSFSISGSGNKTFSTSLTLTHGVRAEQMKGDDLSMYTGIKKEDLEKYDAATTEEVSGEWDSLQRRSTIPGNIEFEDAFEDEATLNKKIDDSLPLPNTRKGDPNGGIA